jgi:hypothetical protein
MTCDGAVLPVQLKTMHESVAGVINDKGGEGSSHDEEFVMNAMCSDI